MSKQNLTFWEDRLNTYPSAAPFLPKPFLSHAKFLVFTSVVFLCFFTCCILCPSSSNHLQVFLPSSLGENDPTATTVKSNRSSVKIKCVNSLFVLSRSQNSYPFISTLPLHLVFAVPLLLHKYSASTGLFQSLHSPFQFTTTLFPIQKVIYFLISSISSFLFPVVAFIAHLDVLLFLLYIALLEAQELRGTKPLNLLKLHPVVIILPSGSMGRLVGFFQEMSAHCWNPGHEALQDLLPSETIIQAIFT